MKSFALLPRSYQISGSLCIVPEIFKIFLSQFQAYFTTQMLEGSWVWGPDIV